jgi:hypothetical protein
MSNSKHCPQCKRTWLGGRICPYCEIELVAGAYPETEAPPIHMLVRDRQSFVLGMELAMRIAGNRANDRAAVLGVPNYDLSDPEIQALATARAMIRLVQVEIGSGRMPVPNEWTPDEIDEVGRIA